MDSKSNINQIPLNYEVNNQYDMYEKSKIVLLLYLLETSAFMQNLHASAFITWEIRCLYIA
jgi:hypothetical protein